MRFENKSLKLLSITKSKAKMYEFGLDEEHHINLTESPSKLLLMTIGILGDFCSALLSDENDNNKLDTLHFELRNVARYFDALIESKVVSEHNYYLFLLGGAAYYLADMPGSSTVLLRKIEQYRENLTPSGIEFLIEFVLKVHEGPSVILGHDDDIPYQEFLDRIPIPIWRDSLKVWRFLSIYFNSKKATQHINKTDKEHLKRLADRIVRYFLEYGSDRDLLIAQVLAALIEKKVSNSIRALLPKYTGLDWSKWSQAALKPSFIKELWPAQKLLGKAGVFSGRSAVIQLPTSVGKTKSAELIIRSAFLAERATVAVILAPFRSLCREIGDSLSQAFAGEDILVNQLSDISQIDEFDTELFTQLFEQAVDINISPSIIVATPEKLVYLLRHKPELAETISLVIYDEGHQFDTGARGVTYELLLTSLKQKLRPEAQHVLISAVLSNAASIGDWLYAGEGNVVNGSDCLSTERSVAFSSWRRELGQLHYVDPLNPNAEEFFVPRVLESLPIPLRGRESQQKFFPNKSDKTSIAAYLGLKLSEQGPVAVFCGTKKIVASICELIVAVNERLPELPNPRASSDHIEIDKIAKLAGGHFGNNFSIVRAIEKGVLPHSTGIPNGLRVAIEFAMEHGLGRCIICTSTLAQGVNLPIKYLVVAGVFQGQKCISTRDFHNLLGRAGRAGKHTEGSIIFTDTELFDGRRSSKRRQWNQMSYLLDPSQSEHCSSSLLTLVQPFQDDELGVDPIKFIENSDKYENLAKRANEHQKGKYNHILDQMKSRRAYVKSLESFVLASSDEQEIINSDRLAVIYTQTLAYSLASEKDKQKLAHVFNIVASKVNQIAPNKRSYFGKALLGIEELNFIEGWLQDNLNVLSEESTGLGVLNRIWEVIKKLSSSNKLSKLIGEDAGIMVAKLWCSGVSYFEILEQTKRAGVKYRAGTQERKLTIEIIIDICDSSLGYDAMMIIGACADLLENLFGNPDITRVIRQLQMSIKIGLSDSLAIDLYSLGLVDRIVASELAESLKASGADLNIFGKSLISNYRYIIEPELTKYPSVFSKYLYGNG
ncbi:DEAD/DEAH box helicase [Xenorhabdus sp. 42]|uniref:DEAD/DEAH box helicase n=1 Tax=Xenorhabdus szentirmaii TaxID=290112 RepID=UPI0019B565B8|nr:MULTISPECIES: DEAD/DEAH box helicase [unclassified Xenorhabdus]MBD2790702.1 DEAD/DEAH box helicase [Xenorhabdus sp. CUL]MBD2820707.1 DEAD/DEAH box helicase [Xenorhabdus sp. 42]MBD2824050.1 DEAD/DEAH box helicase [Xenorhabdus sp. 5]